MNDVVETGAGAEPLSGEEEKLTSLLLAAEANGRRSELAARRAQLLREIEDLDVEMSQLDNDWDARLNGVSKEDVIDLLDHILDLRSKVAELTARAEGRLEEAESTERAYRKDRARQFRQGYQSGYADAKAGKEAEPGRTRGYVKHGYDSGYADARAGHSERVDEAWTECQVRLDRRRIVSGNGVAPSADEIDASVAGDEPGKEDGGFRPD